jgi:hypothetical protein
MSDWCDNGVDLVKEKIKLSKLIGIFLGQKYPSLENLN